MIKFLLRKSIMAALVMMFGISSLFATMVTFTVNLSNETVATDGAFIAGSFNNWSDEAMTDNGDGTWSVTMDLADGDYLFKFKNGASGWENVDANCGQDDGFGGYNRNITVDASTTSYGPFCFSSCANCALTCDQNPMAIICDNFDSYVTTMTTGQQSAGHWTTWSGATGTNEDGIVSETYAASAPNSMKILATGANGGPQDVVLDLGTRTSGNYSLKFKVYIPAGKAGYYNVQNVVPIGSGAWNNNMFFNADGTAEYDNASEVIASFAFEHDAWFQLETTFDLDNDLSAMYFNGQLVSKFAYPNNLGGLDFYGTNANNEFYIDDVEFVELPPVVYNVDECASALDITTLFGYGPGVPQTSAIQDNTTATLNAATDVAGSCFGDLPSVDISNTMWYTFAGDGNTYHIETVPCAATNYIGVAVDDPGDTQMAIFTGDCGNLTEVACSEDLYGSGVPDWRSGVDLETEPGVDYLMLIDGFNFQGTVATGEFCIEVQEFVSVDCSLGAVGGSQLENNGMVCDGNSTATGLSIPNVDDFVIPTVGPVYGMCWAISTEPLDASVWPPDQTSYWGSFFVSPNITIPNLTNDGDPLEYGVWYFTPVVVAGAVNNGSQALHGLDASNGCFFVGESQQILMLPTLEPITATANIINDDGSGNGGIDLTPSGGLSVLVGQDVNTYNWSNGASTQDVTNLTQGNYTVTISDISGCVDDGVFTFTVQTVGAEDPASVLALTVSPNPTSGLANITLNLEAAADVRIDLVNAVGQKVVTRDLGKIQSSIVPVDFSNVAAGMYMLRISIGNETAVRSIMINR